LSKNVFYLEFGGPEFWRPMRLPMSPMPEAGHDSINFNLLSLIAKRRACASV